MPTVSRAAFAAWTCRLLRCRVRHHAVVPNSDDRSIELLHRWLVEGLGDYIGLWQLIRAIGDERAVPWGRRNQDAALRDEVVRVVYDMVASGWFAWCGDEFQVEDIDAHEVTRRVRERWGTADFDHAIWFALTSAGRAVAETLV